jgi:spore germination protein KC
VVKRRRLLFLFLFSLTALAGCWSRMEINQLAIVRAMAVDYLPGRRAPYIVTIAVIRPAEVAGGGDVTAGGGGGSPVRLFMGAGTSIDLALARANFNLSRRVYLSHNEVVLLGEEAARQGLNHVVDFIIRNPQMRLTNQLLVVPGIAHEILTQDERLERGVTDEILGLLEQARVTSEAHPQELFLVLRQLSAPGFDPSIPVLKSGPQLSRVIPELEREKRELQERAGLNSGQEESAGGGQGGAGNPQAEPDTELTLAGTAAFRGDRLAGYLDEIETRGLLWLVGEIRTALMAISDPEAPEETVNILVSESSIKIKPAVKDGRVSFRVEITAEGDLASQGSRRDLSTPEKIKELNGALAGAVKEDTEKALAKMQQLGTDLVGFGAILNRGDHQAFREIGGRWPEVFREIKVDIRVTANIRRTGLLSRPVQISR